ncbi:CIC11C00000003582 [Sungouiella intermedia]|uniref:Presequence translocated-associated motor subunit PAM17 n=1 Tax=Sungouiella intermedia TaxID=45354 RepID=A0A1L0C673_9ASCO|nr:CIC11C00000003582 [[Candida] intermedia]
MLMLKNIGIYARAINKPLTRQSARLNSSTTTMNWVDFFKLRKQNKRINVFSSSLTAFAGAFATLTYLGNVEIDSEKPIMGIDPFMVLGGVVILGGVAGFAVGPFLGTEFFNLRNRNILAQFRAKDLLFLQRVKRYRVDPSSQSFSNPVPDYYGERIYSLENYKQWLRDCNAFRRKSREFL